MSDKNKNSERIKLELLKSIIEKRPFGYTLKEISDIPEIKEKIGTRNTVRKYIETLKEQGEIKSRKIGNYTLYHSKKRLLIKKLFKEYPQLKLFMLNQLKSFTKVLGDNVGVIGKQVGIEMFSSSDRMNSVLMEQIKDFHKSLGEIPIERILRILKLRFAADLEQNIKIENKEDIYYFIIEESEFLKESAYIHFYIQAGIMESILKKVMNQKINVNVDSISDIKCIIKFERESS